MNYTGAGELMTYLNQEIRDGIPNAELELMQQFASGDDSVGDEILRRIQPRVEKTASFLVMDPFDCEEIVQNTLVRVLNSAGQFRGESSLMYWVDRITVCAASRFFEKRDRRRRIAERFWVPPRDCRAGAADDNVDLRRMKDALLVRLNTLRSEQRAVLMLHYLYGYQISEIAELTQVKLNTARGRLRLALKKIRKLVKDDPVLKHWVDEAGSI